MGRPRALGEAEVRALEPPGSTTGRRCRTISCPRTDDVADACRRSQAGDQFDFIDHVLVLRTANGEASHGRAGASHGRQLLRGDDGRARRSGRARRAQAGPAGGGRRGHPSPRTPTTPVMTARPFSRFWLALVEVTRARHLPRPVHRQGQSRPFLLGGVRPGHDSVLRAARAAAPGRGAELSRLGDAEAYSHEVSSCGFWPGGSEEGSFYAYAYPEPAGFAERPRADAAYYDRPGRVRPPVPDGAHGRRSRRGLLAFLQSTYEARRRQGDWDRSALERLSKASARIRSAARRRSSPRSPPTWGSPSPSSALRFSLAGFGRAARRGV